MQEVKTAPNGNHIVKVEKTFGMWFPGMVCGFEPSLAEAHVKAGLCSYVYERAAPSAAFFETSATPVQDPRKSEVEIPDDWAGLHHMSLIALAKKIAGAAAPEITSREAANPIIEAELARRAETKE
jgi:hypothetical protein